HLDMPAWKEKLSDDEINTLAAYIVRPEPGSDGEQLFEQYCVVCHGTRIPSASDTEQARNIISTGGAHITMPVWGDILTPEQLDALVEYTYAASKGGGPAAGARLYEEYCSACHGAYGQGGPNPARAGDTIAPISSAEYLKTRNDATLRSIISQGQPDFGMSPFGDSNGGPLTDEQVDAIVAFIRSWETNPPVTLPPEVSVIPEPTWNSAQIFTLVCASCHGIKGEGDIGPALNTAEFQERYDDQALIEIITSGHEATPMIAWEEILSADQIEQLAEYIRTLPPSTDGESTPTAAPSFSDDVSPILQEKCQLCHNASTKLGGWDASSYDAVMTTGDHAPVAIPGDVENSLLAQLIQGIGSPMPPSGSLPPAEIKVILDWIAAGAEND
ncbi:MAG TPA: c-type cytochrome, partial [Anaerolineales bacterium]|nr:c-type cytochrome [Anaerolineales bacterium]